MITVRVCYREGNIFSISLTGHGGGEYGKDLVCAGVSACFIGALNALVEKDGFYELETNIYEILGDYSNGIITSDILGKAFEPEQRFEERDESDIIFNVDFYGNHRGVSTIPGPLA